MNYIFLIYTDADVMEDGGRSDISEHLTFTEGAIRDGSYVTCDALQPPSAATTVRVRDGSVLTHDGPFAETREVLGGFYVLDCPDLDAAIAAAAKIPPARHGSIEIRPIFPIPGWDDAVAEIRSRVTEPVA